MLAALKSATSSSAAKSAAKPEPAKPAKPTSEVARLQDQADAFTRKIELERRRGVDLETEIRKTKEKIDEQRRKMGGVDAAREDTVKTQRQIKILENRLDKALAKHNEALAKNKQLRLTVDDLRKERLVFDDIYEKLQHELEEKKLEMGNVIEVSNKAFEARDRAVHEMARLKTQANKEQAAFECEFAELGKQIEHDRRMKEFMRHRADDSEARAAEISRQAALAEAENNKKLVKSKWTLAKDRVSQGITAARVNSYAAAFATIAEFTGESDVEKLVEQFVEAEDENFRLFSYVNQLNAEIEKLEDSIAELTREIAKHRGESTTHDAEKARAVKALDERLRRAEARARMYDRKYATATATMGKLKDGAWRVFNKIGCNTEVNRSLLGEDGVTDHNVMQYLGVIEQRTNEILQMFAASRTARGRLAGGDKTVPARKRTDQTPARRRRVRGSSPRGSDVVDGDRVRAAHRTAEHDRAQGGRRLRGGGRRAASDEGRDPREDAPRAAPARSRRGEKRLRRGGGDGEGRSRGDTARGAEDARDHENARGEGEGERHGEVDYDTVDHVRARARPRRRHDARGCPDEFWQKADDKKRSKKKRLFARSFPSARCRSRRGSAASRGRPGARARPARRGKTAPGPPDRRNPPGGGAPGRRAARPFRGPPAASPPAMRRRAGGSASVCSARTSTAATWRAWSASPTRPSTCGRGRTTRARRTRPTTARGSTSAWTGAERGRR
jgi:hypothetical protein